MNLSEMEILFRTRVRDLTIPYSCSSVEFYDSINAAEREACRRKSLIRDKSTTEICEITVTQGDRVFPLHGHIVDIEHAYLISEAGTHIRLTDVDTVEMDRILPGWREVDSRQPARYIVHDTTIELDANSDAAYTLMLEVYRLPIADMTTATSSPEIAATHHEKLLYWAMKEYYEIPISKVFNEKLAVKNEGRFTDYFGIDRQGNARKRSWSNRPQHNKLW